MTKRSSGVKGSPAALSGLPSMVFLNHAVRVGIAGVGREP